MDAPVIDRPLIRVPPTHPDQDRWMLDRWTPAEAHHVIGVYRETKDREGRVIDTMYRCVCSCGWRSREYHQPLSEPCPVLGALVERAQRIKKDGERINWKEVSRGV